MEIILSSEQKRAIYNSVMSMESPLGRYSSGDVYDNLNVVDFLKLIWDLPTMPSEDDRFRNAEADAHQHMLNNDDWTLDDALLRRFNLLAGDQKYFEKFVEVIVSPEVRTSKDDIEHYVSAVNSALTEVDCELAIKDYVDELPVYRLMAGKNHDTLPSDLSPNSIPIFINVLPDSYPCFCLREDTWDDYGHKTRYMLSYCLSEQQQTHIGQVRIMIRDNCVSYGNLPTKVTSFGKDICSLGQNLTYYETIKELLGVKYRNFLNAMRDAAIFSKICDAFCDTIGFKHSLLRYPPAEEAFLYAVHKLAGYSVDDPFSFIFKAEVPYYKGDYLNVKFDLGKIQDKDNLNRIIALIGNNGVGKTTVLSQLAEYIVKGVEDRFEPKKPIFKKVISASYSIFDNFYKIEGSSFNYTYCGIQKKGGGLMSQEDVDKRRIESIFLIKLHERHSKLYKYMRMLLPLELVDAMFNGNEEFDEQKYMDIHQYLSSGQSMLMNLIIEIVANIRHNTLILLDEPEVHLHPKGITKIINILNEICSDFSSCCILATHSAVIIQELLSRNVIVMDREEDGRPIVRPMRVESLGENLTTITEDVFGRGDVPPYYKKMVKKLVGDSRDLNQVLQAIQNNDVPISMPLYMLIDKYFSQK